MGYSKNTQGHTSATERKLISNIWKNVTDFINMNNLGNGGSPVTADLTSAESFGQTNAACEAFNSTFSFADAFMNPESLAALCDKCDLKNDRVKAMAIPALGQLLFNNRGNGGTAQSRHFATSSTLPDQQKNSLLDLHQVIPQSLHAEFLSPFTPGVEAFGADTDRVLPDIRIAMTVTLLKFHRGLLNRVMHRRTSPQTVVNYVIPWAEVYDLNKSMAPNSKDRQSQEHRKPFIHLYGDPSMVSNTLRRIEVLKDNDDDDVLLADNYIRCGKTANMMDLSRLPNTYGFTMTDYTDLIADGAILESVVVRFTSGGKTEDIEFDTAPYYGSRLIMHNNNRYSGDRRSNFTQTFLLNKSLKTMAGTDTEIFANLTDRECIKCMIDASPFLSLQWADTRCTGSAYPTPYHPDVDAIPAAVVTVMSDIKAEVVAYKLDAKFSEENLRKSNVAVRSHYKVQAWEIPVGRNYIVDYALQQALPEYVMSNVTEAISLGQDDRMLKIVSTTLRQVYDRIKAENPNPEFRAFEDRVGFEYVASQLVNPYVIVSTIDCSNVDSIRSSDILGDIRQYVELQLINIFSLIHQNSFYKTQLNSGEKPVYKLITSSIILENLFNIPHIHNHMAANTDMSFDGEVVEYRRVLPNGVVLECVSCTYNTMRDKILIFPYREGDPESILNFGHNWDFGTYLAHYNPQIGGGVNKRVFANAREMPLITNPIGIYLNVVNISKLIDLYAKISLVPTETPLPLPANP